MIIAGHLLLDDGFGGCRTDPGWIRVEDSRITHVETGEIPGSADIGDRGTLVSPGFIDAHLHLPQFDMIGGHGLPLLRWLNQFTFPEEMRWADIAYAKSMSHRVMNQLLSFGTTGICAFRDRSSRFGSRGTRNRGWDRNARRHWTGVDGSPGAAGTVS